MAASRNPTTNLLLRAGTPTKNRGSAHAGGSLRHLEAEVLRYNQPDVANSARDRGARVLGAGFAEDNGKRCSEEAVMRFLRLDCQGFAKSGR
jgi:hypothetical protein